MQRNRRTSRGLGDVRNNRREDDQTGDICGNRSRLTAMRNGLTCPGTERRMRRIMIVVRMLTGV